MAQASVAIKSARVYLNDTNATSWTDAILLPLLQEAHGELQLQLEINGVDVIKNQTDIILVPAGSKNLGANLPTNLVDPLTMKERVPGDLPDTFIDMLRVTYLPEADPTVELTYWEWRRESINFIGALSDREVLLQYKGSLPVPQTLTDPLGFIYAERFLGPKTAALALNSISKDGSKLDAVAASNLYNIIQYNVTDDQRPVRRRGYRSPKWLGPFGASRPLSVSGGGGVVSDVQFITPNVPPDGIASIFTFTNTPKQIVYNGVWLFLNKGFKLVGPNQISLFDVNNVLIIPDAGADIEAQIA